MLTQLQGKMFVSAERGYTEADGFRRYNTFNFGNYQHPDKLPFHPLYVLNNDTLAGGSSFSLLVEEDTDMVIIPTVGAVRYTDHTGMDTLIEAGQALLSTILKGTTITFENPYEEDLVNFLQLWLKRTPVSHKHSSQIFSFDLENNKNQLVDLFAGTDKDEPESSRFFLGKFSGREETMHHLSAGNNALFVYILEGAYEVAYRLLEAGDGLALWNVNEAEIEALSNDAIIVVVEMQVDNV